MRGKRRQQVHPNLEISLRPARLRLYFLTAKIRKILFLHNVFLHFLSAISGSEITISTNYIKYRLKHPPLYLLGMYPEHDKESVGTDFISQRTKTQCKGHKKAPLVEEKGCPNQSMLSSEEVSWLGSLTMRGLPCPLSGRVSKKASPPSSSPGPLS